MVPNCAVVSLQGCRVGIQVAAEVNSIVSMYPAQFNLRQQRGLEEAEVENRGSRTRSGGVSDLARGFVSTGQEVGRGRRWRWRQTIRTRTANRIENNSRQKRR